tara:strand:+ start:724 stop:1038 length:315 start_codon:yes stop_codon:yes gene_type:complete
MKKVDPKEAEKVFTSASVWDFRKLFVDENHGSVFEIDLETIETFRVYGKKGSANMMSFITQVVNTGKNIGWTVSYRTMEKDSSRPIDKYASGAPVKIWMKVTKN